MSATWNGKQIVDRSHIGKPRNFTDMIGITNDLKSEIHHYISLQMRIEIEEELDAARRKQEMHLQKMRGFSGDRNEQSRIGGGNH